MSNPHRLGQFADIKEILDAAIACGGEGSVELGDHGKAVHWRQRAYTFRKRFAENLHPSPSPYDALTFKRLEPTDTCVRIARMGQKAVFTPAQAPAVFSPTVAEDDDLLSFAKSLSTKLDGDQ